MNIPTLKAADTGNMQYYNFVQGMIGETFGQALTRYMAEMNIDIPELSEMTGISMASICCYCNDKRNISMENTAAICIALRLYPLRSLFLFELAHYQLNRQDRHDLIIYRYIFGCAFDSSFTLTACNHELILNRFKPLTKLREEDVV